MKLLDVGHGFYAKVDDEDYEHLLAYRWRTLRCRYPSVIRKGKPLLMHRLIMACPVGMVVDHIDHDILNCQKSNLRICTRQQNNWNKSPMNATKGVVQQGGCWKARIKKDGVMYTIGYFATLRHATLAYDLWADLMFGEYACLNHVKAA